MKKLLHWVWSILEVIIVLHVIIVTSFLLCKNKYGFTQFGDYTFESVNLVDERNIQDANKGDLLIVKNSNDIHVGDLIYYYAAFNETYIIRSDYVTAIDNDDYSSLYTVHRADSDVTISSIRVLGKYANTYSTIGGILEVFESRIGFLFFVLLPIMIVFIYQVYEFIVIIRYERVDDIDDDEDDEKEVKPKKEASQKDAIEKENVKIEKDVSNKSFLEEKETEKPVEKFKLMEDSSDYISKEETSIDDKIREELSSIKQDSNDENEDSEIL